MIDQTVTPQKRRRQNVANAMMAEGSSTAPVQHFSQGLARLAQGAVGGAMAREAMPEQQPGAPMDIRPPAQAVPVSGVPAGGPYNTGPIGSPYQLAPPMWSPNVMREQLQFPGVGRLSGLGLG